MKLNHESAKHLMLAAMGLAQPPSRPAAKEDVLSAIREMGALQIDTIHVVARSPYLVLWSRLGDYDPTWLDEHLAEGALFEYWAHAMCFLPIEDYPLFRRQMFQRGEKNWVQEWIEQHPQVVEEVLGYIREHGSARASSFQGNGSRPSGGWWDWKDEKTALDTLLTTGELMIARREKFQRVYTLRENILPDWDDAHTPSAEVVAEALTLKTVHALGITQPAWAWDYYRQPKNGMAARLEGLAVAGRLLRVEVDGWEAPGYVHPDRQDLLEQAAAGEICPQLTTLLSPFDPLIWDRQRVKAIFGMDYTIECYLPAAKRRYGYFSLPILYAGQLVGRLDPKAHRKEGLFEVKAFHLEPGVEPEETLLEAVAVALRRIARWHKTPQVVVRQSDPNDAADFLNSFLK